MKLITKICLIAASIILVIGGILAIIGLSMGAKKTMYITSDGLQIDGLTDTETSSKTFSLEKTEIDSFENMDFGIVAADCEIAYSDDGKYYIEYYYENVVSAPSYSVNNNTFFFNDSDIYSKTPSAIMVFDFNFQDITDLSGGDRWVKVYIPEDSHFLNVTSDSEAGNISIEGLSADEANFTLDAGNLSIHSFDSAKSVIELSAGDVEFDTVACDNLTAHVSAGNITIGSISGDTHLFDTDAGNINISNISSHNLTADSDCGNIELLFADDSSKYAVDSSCSLGILSVNGNVISSSSYITEGPENEAHVNCSLGNIDIRYAK